MAPSRMRVEVLVVEGCPNAEPAVQLVRDAAAEAGIDPEIAIVCINDLEAARTLRFLGSPSIRVDGADVEYGFDQRAASLGCRIYQGDSGPSGVPDRHWVVTAFRNAAQSARV